MVSVYTPSSVSVSIVVVLKLGWCHIPLVGPLQNFGPLTNVLKCVFLNENALIFKLNVPGNFWGSMIKVYIDWGDGFMSKLSEPMMAKILGLHRASVCLINQLTTWKAIVVADALVLMHQDITSHNTDSISIMTAQFHSDWSLVSEHAWNWKLILKKKMTWLFKD